MKASRNGRAWIKTITATFFIVAFAAFTLLSYFAGEGRLLVRKSAMSNLGNSMHEYYQQHERFPEAVTTAGGHSHSWRVLIENAERKPSSLQKFALDQPWNSPNNIRIGNGPAYSGFEYLTRGRVPGGPSIFFVVTGSGTAFPDSGSVRIEDITDGIENTVLVIEALGSKQPWAMPGDISFSELHSLYDEKHDLSLKGHRGFCVLFADLTGWLMVEMPRYEIFESLFTVSGGEPWTRQQLIEAEYLLPLELVARRLRTQEANVTEPGQYD